MTTHVKIQLGVSELPFLQEVIDRDDSSQTRFHMSDGTAPSCIFRIDWDKRFSGTLITCHSWKSFADINGRWTVYGRPSIDTPHKTWHIAPERGNILVNQKTNDGVRWDNDDNQMVVRQKHLDSSCQPVIFHRIQYVTCREKVTYLALAENVTDHPIRTSISKKSTEYSSRTVFRKEFKSVQHSMQLKIEGTYIAPTYVMQARMDAIIATKKDWKNEETVIETKTHEVTQETFTLQPNEGRYLKVTDFNYSCEGTPICSSNYTTSEFGCMLDENGEKIL